MTTSDLLILVNIIMNTVQVVALTWIAAKYRANGYKS
jgi:hypothetical protein